MPEPFHDFYVDLSSTDYLDLLLSKLEKDGLVTFDSISDKQRFLRLGCEIGTIFPHRDSDQDGLTLITAKQYDNIKKGFAGFAQNELVLHTDRSGVLTPPLLLLTYCSKPAVRGGLSVMSDGRKIYNQLLSECPKMLEILCTPESVILGGGDNLFVGSVFTRLADGQVSIRFRYDSLGYFSAPVSSVIAKFVEIINANSFAFKLEQGQGYILQNTRWLHGRTEFEGERELYRLLANLKQDLATKYNLGSGFTI